MKKALITGVTGQDGSYLAEFLLEKGYEVHGIKRRASSFNTQRVDHIFQDPHEKNKNFHLHYGDLTDSSNLTRILSEIQPDEVYNLCTSELSAIHAASFVLGTLDDALREIGFMDTVQWGRVCIPTHTTPPQCILPLESISMSLMSAFVRGSGRPTAFRTFDLSACAPANIFDEC